MKGIEPSCVAWEATVLPLNYTRSWICDFRLPIGNLQARTVGHYPPLVASRMKYTGDLSGLSRSRFGKIRAPRKRRTCRKAIPRKEPYEVVSNCRQPCRVFKPTRVCLWTNNVQLINVEPNQPSSQTPKMGEKTDTTFANRRSRRRNSNLRQPSSVSRSFDPTPPQPFRISGPETGARHDYPEREAGIAGYYNDVAICPAGSADALICLWLRPPAIHPTKTAALSCSQTLNASLLPKGEARQSRVEWGIG